MKRFFLSTIFFWLSIVSVFAQSVTNIRFETSGKVIDVYYDLSAETSNNYKVTVFCSQNGGKTWGLPLKNLKGAVGDNVKPGLNLKVIWDVLLEHDKIVGEIKFKVEAIPASSSELSNNSNNDKKPGISYDLSGRNAISLFKPYYKSLETGKIVILIKVNRQGQVTFAKVQTNGTTIIKIALHDLAESAALKSTFIPDANGPAELQGTITYVFL